MLAIERDVKPRNMNFVKVEGGGGGDREGAFVWINTVSYIINTTVLDEHFSVEIFLAKDFQEFFLSLVGRAFHKFVPSDGNIWTRSLVQVLISGKLPSIALLCGRFTVCTGYSDNTG